MSLIVLSGFDVPGWIREVTKLENMSSIGFEAMKDTRVAENIVYSFMGLAIPLAVGLFTIPLLIAVLGNESFGLLTLIWAFVAYFGLLDLGLGKALTYFVSLALTKKDAHELECTVMTGCSALTLLGVFLASILFGSSYYWADMLFANVLSSEEASGVIFFLSLTVPIVLLGSAVRSVLEGAERFALLNLIRLPFGVYTFVAPLVASYIYAPDLKLIMQVLLVGRLLQLAVLFIAAKSIASLAIIHLRIDYQILVRMVRFGGWVAFANVLAQLMGYVDRFVIGLVVGASAVTFYVTPQELILKLGIVPMAVTAVMFPRFIKMLELGDPRKGRLFYLSIISILVVVGLPAVVTYIYSYELLAIWIDEEVAAEGFLLLKVFCIGVVVNSIAHMPFTLIQAYGKSSVIAKFNAIQFPLYILAVYYSSIEFGLLGVSLVWLLRLFIDNLFMFLNAYILSRTLYVRSA